MPSTLRGLRGRPTCAVYAGRPLWMAYDYVCFDLWLQLFYGSLVAAPTLLIPFFPLTYYVHYPPTNSLLWLNKFIFTPSSHLYPPSQTESVRPYRPTFSSAHYPSTTPFCFFSTLFPFLFCNLTRCLCTAIPAYSVYCVPSFAYGFASLSLRTLNWYTCFPLFSSFVLGVLPTHRGLLPPFLAL